MGASFPEPIPALLDLQRGVLTAQQLQAAGLSRDLIRSRLRGGRWQPLHRGVYATFTGQPDRAATLWAVVLRAGTDAMLSHHTAAELDGLAGQVGSLIHVTVPISRRVTGIPGVAMHVTEHAANRRHPARTPPRTRIEETVLDLAELAVTLDDAYGWMTRAIGRRLTTAPRLQAALAGRPRHRWRADLARALTPDWAGIHSWLEYRYVRDVEQRHQLPAGRRQARVRRAGRSEYRDVLYDAYNVAVEVDGRAAHPGDSRWTDIRRDNAAAADGILTLRYGWLDVSQRPCQCAAQVAHALGRHGPIRSRPCSPACPVPQSG